ncbi:MAG: class I SAM-dependent methyltransferase [Pirellulales bacterium]
MKIALVTLSAGEEFERMAALVNGPKRRFCERWGYDFVEFHELLDAQRPAAWSKIRAVERVLPEYDWVVWCDVDTVLWKAHDGLRQYIAAAHDADFILQCDHYGINTGVFFVRNCDWAFSFLEKVYRQEKFIHDPWWEQAAVIDLLERDDTLSHCHILPPGETGGGFHGFIGCHDWDKTFIHFAGIRASERLPLVENLVRLAELPFELRLLTRDRLGTLLNRVGLLGEGVEVGVAAGDYSKTILDFWEGRRLHLVDAWRRLPDYHDINNLSDEEHRARLDELPEKLAAHRGRYQIHRMLTDDAAAEFKDESLDFVYLDANHTYESTTRSLRLWYGKLRRGGLLAGHDFLDGHLPEAEFGVRSAVIDFERAKQVRAAVTPEPWPSWYLFKP